MGFCLQVASSSTDVGLGLPAIDAKCQATDAPVDVTTAQQLDQMAASYLQDARTDSMIAHHNMVDDGSNGVDPTAVQHHHDSSQPSVVPGFQYQFSSQHLTLQPPPPPTSSAADVGLDFAMQQQQLQQQQQQQQTQAVAVSSTAAAATAASHLVAAAAATSSTYPPSTLYYSSNGGSTSDDLSMTSQASAAAAMGNTQTTGSAGAQFNSFVEISTDFSTDFSTEFLILQGVPHYYKNSVEKSVEISTKLLN